MADLGELLTTFVHGGMKEFARRVEESLPAESVNMTPGDLYDALGKALDDTGDPEKAVAASIMLACVLARRAGWNGTKLATTCPIIWRQTEFMTRTPEAIGETP